MTGSEGFMDVPGAAFGAVYRYLLHIPKRNRQASSLDYLGLCVGRGQECSCREPKVSGFGA